jgi:hypothetical protein
MRSLSVQKQSEMLKKVLYILQPGLNYAIKLVIVNFPIDVNQTVSEA